MLYVHQSIPVGRKRSEWLSKPHVLHPMLVETLNLLHVPSASTIILEADFKAVIHRGLNPDRKLPEIIKASVGCLAPSVDALVSTV